MRDRWFRPWGPQSINTAAWALLLLLLTNVGWSVWFAWAAVEGRYRGTELNIPGQSHGVLKQGKGLYLHVNRTDYGPCTSIRIVAQSVPRHVEASWGEEYSEDYFTVWSALRIEEVTPPWLWDQERGEFYSTVQRQIVRDGLSPTISLVGWPVRLLWCAEAASQEWDSGDYTMRAVRGTGIQVAPGRISRVGSAADLFEPGVEYGRVLPVRPMWTGQVAYAAFWFVLLYMVRFFTHGARCTWRRRRGRCAHCAYDLRGTTSGVCPECGTSIARVGRWRCSSPRERLLRRIAVAMLLGAATSWLAAWAGALFSDHQIQWSNSSSIEFDDGTRLVQVTSRAPGRLRVLRAGCWAPRPGVSPRPYIHSSQLKEFVVQFGPPSLLFGLEPMRSRVDFEFGVPFRSMSAQLAGFRARSPTVIGVLLNEGDAGFSHATARVLPTRIIWSGFIADTAIFACICFGLMQTAQMLWLRRRLARCTQP